MWARITYPASNFQDRGLRLWRTCPNLRNLRVCLLPQKLLSLLIAVFTSEQTEELFETATMQLWTIEPPIFVTGSSRPQDTTTSVVPGAITPVQASVLIASYLDHMARTPYNKRGALRKADTLQKYVTAAAEFLARVMTCPFLLERTVAGKTVMDPYIAQRLAFYCKWDIVRPKARTLHHRDVRDVQVTSNS